VDAREQLAARLQRRREGVQVLREEVRLALQVLELLAPELVVRLLQAEDTRRHARAR
jgi:hypothetical protein